MSTHSKIFLRVKGGDEFTTYCKLYIHWDGCIDGVGTDLIKFLLNKKLVNGINITDKDVGEQVNGPGCLFAMIVAYFKKETPKVLPSSQAGNVYIQDPNSDEEEEWNYYVDCDHTEPIKLTINSERHGFNFSGSVQEAYQRFVINREHVPLLSDDAC